MKLPKMSYMPDLPVHYRYGWGGIGSPEFRAAIISAYKHVGVQFRLCSGAQR